MTEVRVGDVRKDDCDIYVIRKIENNVVIGMYKDTQPEWSAYTTDCEDDKLLKHYDTWQEAIASKEFNQ